MQTFVESLISCRPAAFLCNVGVNGHGRPGRPQRVRRPIDFVHRTHVDLFGVFYPRIYVDRQADDWMSTVYNNSTSMMLFVDEKAPDDNRTTDPPTQLNAGSPSDRLDVNSTEAERDQMKHDTATLER